MIRGRTSARSQALKILYMSEIRSEEANGTFDPGSFLNEDLKDFAKEIVEGVVANLKEIDEKIEKASENWKLYRMSIIDRNILRIGCYEILYCPAIQGSVTINEAVNLAKKFGGSESGAFVNGVLDRIARESGKIVPKNGNEDQFSADITRK